MYMHFLAVYTHTYIYSCADDQVEYMQMYVQCFAQIHQREKKNTKNQENLIIKKSFFQTLSIIAQMGF